MAAAAAAVDPSQAAAFQASCEAVAGLSITVLDEKQPELDWHRWMQALMDVVLRAARGAMSGPAPFKSCTSIGEGTQRGTSLPAQAPAINQRIVFMAEEKDTNEAGQMCVIIWWMERRLPGEQELGSIPEPDPWGPMVAPGPQSGADQCNVIFVI